MTATIVPIAMKNRTDQDLALQVAKGDADALGELRDRYWASSYRVALSLTGDPSAAEDVAQEALVRLFLKAGSYRADRPFRPWFFRIVRRLASDHGRASVRRKRREQDVGGRSLAMSRFESPEAALVRHELQAAVRDGLASLQESLREALVLRHQEGLSLKECAETLDCPEGTVSSRVRRGLEALKRQLGVAIAPAALAALLPEAAAAGSVPSAPSVASLVARARRAGAGAPEQRRAGASPPASRMRSVPLAALALGVMLMGGVAAWRVIDGGDAPIEGNARVATTRPARPTIPGEARSPSTRTPSQVAAKPGSIRAPASDAAAQAASAVRLRGRVTIGSLPLSGAEVRLSSPGEDLVTDADGRFEVTWSSGRSYFGLQGVTPVPRMQNGYGYGSLYDLRSRLLANGVELALDSHGRWMIPGDVGTLMLEIEVPSGLLHGRIVDLRSQEPVPGAVLDAGDLRVIATSDGGGAFELPLPVKSGIMGRTGGFVRVTAPGYATAAVEVYSQQHFGKPTTVRLARGRTVPGRVVDDRRDGVSGVIVHVTEWVRVQGGGGPSWAPLHTHQVETAADGRFTLTDIGPQAGDLRSVDGLDLRVDGASSEEFSRRFHPLRRKHVRSEGGLLVLTLKRRSEDRRLEGRVVDPEGQPIRGAVVTPLGEDPAARFASYRRYSILHDGAGERLVDAFRSRHGIRTDANGRFGATLPGAPQPLMITAEGFADRVVEPGAALARIVLGRAHPVTGRAVDGGGEPLAGWRVDAYPAGTFAKMAKRPRLFEDLGGLHRRRPTRSEALAFVDEAALVAEAMCDKAGRFSLPGLASTAHDIVLRSERGSLAALLTPTVRILERVAAGADLGDVSLPKSGGLLTVQVWAAEDGSPLKSAYVVLRRGDRSARPVPLHPTGEDAARFPAGTTLFRAPFPAPFEAEVRAPGRAPVLRPARGQGQLDLGAVSLERAAGTIALEVSYPKPAPKLTSAGVYLVSPGGLVHRYALGRSGSPQRLEITELGPGPHRLFVVLRASADGPVRALPILTATVGGGRTTSLVTRVPADLGTLRTLEQIPED